MTANCTSSAAAATGLKSSTASPSIEWSVISWLTDREHHSGSAASKGQQPPRPAMTQSGLIDIHTHVVPRSLPSDPGSKAPWPCMSCAAGGKAMLKLGEMPFRELDERSWSVKRRCVDMDRDGVALQLLSPMPELLSYWQSDDDAEYLADHVNAAIGEMVSKEPTRFVGLGMAPFQSPARAVCYVERLRERFGLLGIEIGSNINGALPGDAQFDPIFAAIE